MLKLLISFALLTFSISSFADPMPGTLPADYLADQNFIHFKEPASSFSPLYVSLKINGAMPSSAEATDLFSETTWANIPNKTQIIKKLDAKNREIWSYPVGTEVAHEIFFNDAAQTLFELRIMRKISDTEWDFASYSPNSSARNNTEATLKRHRYTGSEDFSTQLQITATKKIAIDLKRINLVTCKNCHFMNSPASYQYATRDQAGPCGFAPGNDAGIKTWIDEFKKTYQYDPFR